MAEIVAFIMSSLDGYANDKAGNIDWHTPDRETHEFINVRHARHSDHIYDEPTYQIMKYWENVPKLEAETPVMQEYADLWKRIRKFVVTRGLAGLDPEIYTVWPELSAERLHGVKQRATGEILLGGIGLVTNALELGLLDRIDLFTLPVLLGGGEPCFSAVPRTQLKLVESRLFTNGWVFTSYKVG